MDLQLTNPVSFVYRACGDTCAHVFVTFQNPYIKQSAHPLKILVLR